MAETSLRLAEERLRQRKSAHVLNAAAARFKDVLNQHGEAAGLSRQELADQNYRAAWLLGFTASVVHGERDEGAKP